MISEVLMEKLKHGRCGKRYYLASNMAIYFLAHFEDIYTLAKTNSESWSHLFAPENSFLVGRCVDVPCFLGISSRT